ncbi:MAG: hypothetical protein LBR28_06830 [Bacteroidales bacterium]|jgi:outer membrane protein assembly factor BamD (BamD/ComL family)|nr:hypothetical protein [Bacteroidales bacterium]
MKRLVLTLTIIILCFSACKKEQKPDEKTILIQTISQTEMFALQNSEAIDRKIADSLINLYDRFEKLYPQDSLCAEFMYKATDIAVNIKDCTRALEHIQKITDGYSTSDYVEWAYYFKAIIYSDVCNDKDKATEAYKFFLDNYPQSKFAKEANVMLNMLQMQNEMQIIREFEAKNQNKESDSI